MLARRLPPNDPSSFYLPSLSFVAITLPLGQRLALGLNQILARYTQSLDQQHPE
jgi:hypothetical protein